MIERTALCDSNIRCRKPVWRPEVQAVTPYPGLPRRMVTEAMTKAWILRAIAPAMAKYQAELEASTATLARMMSINVDWAPPPDRSPP